MRISIYSLICCFSVLAFITSCKKNDSSGTTNLIRTCTFPPCMLCYTPSSLSYTVAYDYDNLGRRVRTSQTGNVNIIYLPGMVIIQNRDTLFLNNQGLEMRESQSFDQYIYDSSGFLIEDSIPLVAGRGSIVNYTIANGNTVAAITRYWEQGVLTTDTMTYTFYPTIDNRNWGFPFAGKQNTNLIKTQTESRDGSVNVSNYTYMFDAQGRVTKQIDGSNVYSYTYY